MKKFRVALLLVGFVTILYLSSANSVSAHAFGALYNLPVPFWLYLYGAAAALLVSFLLIGFFIQGNTLTLKRPRVVSWGSNGLVNFLKVFGILVFGLSIVTGLIGTNNSLENFNMTFFWVIFLLGFTYLVALLGNFYQFINPWKTLIPNFKGIIKFPIKLGYWLAFIFYFLLIWIELFEIVTPYKLSLILLWYSVINFLGSYIFGKNNWFEYFEFSGIFFKLIAKIGSTEEIKDLSLLVFILFMLSGTAFDGIHQTIPWIKFSLLFGSDNYRLVQQLGLLISPFLFLALNLILIRLMKIITNTKLTVRELCLKFALTLLPIAFVYNVAHYYTLLIIQGQQIMRLISDPFGWGWNLFGTADFIPTLKVMDAGFVWHSQVAFILIGHIIAVYLSHLVSLKIFPNRRQAILSQIPMLILMIIYTTFGLWILSQPLGSI